MPWRGHPSGTVKFSLGKAEGGEGLGGRVSAGSGLEPRRTRSEGPRAPEGENDGNNANRSSLFGDAMHLLSYFTQVAGPLSPHLPDAVAEAHRMEAALVVTQSVSISARSSAEVFLTPVLPSRQR